MRTFAAASALLLVIGACSPSSQRPDDSPKENPPDPVQVSIEAPEEGAEVGGREVLFRARASAEAGLSEARILVGDVEQKRLRLSGTSKQFSQQVALEPGTNRIVVEVEDLEGNTASAERVVTSRALPTKITSFTATPNPARPGDPVELRWEVEAVGTVTFTITGLGEVEGDAVEVFPDLTTEYVLTATNEWGSDTAQVEVQVEPELIPNLQFVAAGSVQELRVAGLEKPGTFSSTGGTLVRPEEEFSWTWTVPEEPGTYEIQVEHAAGTWSRPVEVRAIDPLPPSQVVGVGGNPAPISTATSVIVDPAGRVWAVTTGGVTRSGSDGTTELLARGLAARPEILLLLDDGRPLAAWRPDRSDSTRAYAVWDEPAGRWLLWDDLPPVEHRGNLVVGRNGWQAFVATGPLNQVLSLWRRSPNGVWSELEGPLPRHVALASDGTLLAVHQPTRSEPVELWKAPPATTALEATGLILPELPGSLYVQPDDTLLAVGDGMWSVNWVTGSIEDRGTGLEDACEPRNCMRSLVWQDDALFGLNRSGIYAQTTEGWVQLVDLDGTGIVPRELLSDRSGGLLVHGEAGLYQLPAGETDLRPYGGRGLFGPIRTGSHATAEDGTVAIALRYSRQDVPILALRPAGQTEWTSMGPVLATTRDPTASDLVLDGASRLTLRWEEALLRLPAGATTWEEAEALPAPPGTLGTFTVLQDGTTLAAVDDDGLVRLAPGATTWEAMPDLRAPRSLVQAPDGALWAYDGDGLPRRLAPGSTNWETIAPQAAPMPFAHRGIAPTFGPEGEVWTAAVGQGVQRLEGGMWRAVGSGTCSMQAIHLLVTTSGAVLCAHAGGLQLLEQIDGVEIWVDLEIVVPETPIDALFEGPDGHPWLATADGALFELHLP